MLRPRSVELRRQARLLHLPLHGLLARDVEVPHELLRDRRASLDDRSRRGCPRPPLARSPRRRLPLCWKKRLSSIAIVALRIQSDMSAAATGSRFRSAGIEPRRLPSAAKTNVFAPMSTDRSDARSHDDPYASTAAVPPMPAAAPERKDRHDGNDRAAPAAAPAERALMTSARTQRLRGRGEFACCEAGSCGDASHRSAVIPASGVRFPGERGSRRAGGILQPRYRGRLQRLARLRRRTRAAVVRCAAERHGDAGRPCVPLLVVGCGVHPVRDHAREFCCSSQRSAPA